MCFKYCWIRLLALEILLYIKQVASEDFPNQGVSDQRECDEYLVSGPKYRVSDEQLSVSSQYNDLHAAKWGRLNTVYVKDEHIGGWAAGNGSTVVHYIEVRLNELSIVQAIATQGRNITGDTQTNPQYVTSYHVYYKMEDDTKWVSVKSSGTDIKDFHGNNDSNSILINKLPYAVEATNVRILLKEWQDYPSMRFDVIGCPVSQGSTITKAAPSILSTIPDSITTVGTWTNQEGKLSNGIPTTIATPSLFSTTPDSTTIVGTWTNWEGKSSNEGGKYTKTSRVLVGAAVGVGAFVLAVLIAMGIYVARRRLLRSSAVTTSKQTGHKMALSVENQLSPERNEESIDTGQEYANVMSGKSESVSPDPNYGNSKGVPNIHETRLIKEDCEYAVVLKPKRNVPQETQEEKTYDHLDMGEKTPNLDDETYDHVKK